MKHCVKYSIKRFLFFTISVLSAGLLSVSCVSTSSASGADQTATSIATKDLANPSAKQEDEYTAEQEQPLKEQASDQTDSADFAGLTTEAPSPATEIQDTAEAQGAVETREAAESQIAEESGAIEEPVVYDLPIDETKEIPSDTEEVETILETPVPEELVEADFPERNAATPAMPKIISESTEAKNEIQAPDSTQTPTAAISPRETMRAQSVSESQDKEVKPSAAAQDSVSTADKASLDDSPSAPSAASPIPSRSVSIKKNQYLDVEYPGSGWIYMGGAEKENKMTFFGKKILSENTVFILRSRVSGTTLLHFYKNDLLTGNYIDDYLEVIIENETAGSPQMHVKAPSYADIVPPEPDRTLLEEKQIPQNKETENPAEADFAKAEPTGNSAEASSALSGTRQTRPQSALRSDSVQTAAAAQAAPTSINAENSGSNAGRTVVQATGSDGRSYQVQEARDEKNSAPENMPAVSGRNQTVASESTAVIINQNQNAETSEANDMTSSDILKNAQEAYDKGLYEKSLSLLTDFFEKSQTDVDKALYLQGQNFEAESPIKNIKNAIDSYDMIVKNFRQSPLWRSARERSIYLKRFYIDIR
ncbi:hypothetical protein [Treponema parvum]|uniref:hypothetical protein n=1 Tax=Treponema parvum TaxID=138851 RepID=UPI001AEBE3EA|nr:hypothetical protein [Treponema parvum]QTQ16663.1 hypothetical protein HXT04_08150 [Treponema parvum]